ncbi:3-hydroxyacyl-CoA dehydrogenase, C-terminal domain [Rhizoctonia solani]|uniref:3-hydroxyacyl-CoA dehydrogenase n=1 Tax=Rhizoctonia solani TaxID=456999 RepID=A0A8H7M728_9AGAM|nr:3-hydroxyacyl-CoA dehydrogenase, C-terminal domain [Rhizoctonia solani]
MLRRFARIPRTRLSMTSRTQLSGTIAAARLAQTTGHLTGSNSTSGSSTTSVRMSSNNASSSSSGAPRIEFREINNITCFGAGLMGAGIAQVAAQNGFKVTLCDVTPQALENGLKIIKTSLGRIAKKAHPDSVEQQKSFVDSLASTIVTTTDAQEAVKQADLVVEAIVENLEVKRKLFSSLDSYAPEHCIFATNTSSLSVTEIADSTGENRRSAFGGLHFFNREWSLPVVFIAKLLTTFTQLPQMKLVEVIRTSNTSDATNAALLDVCKRMQKTSVSCKDTPGFIVNRLLVPYMLEAVRMLERGDATAEDIDTAMKLGAGYPMGPIQLTDFVGLDTCQHIMSGWREKGALSPELVQPIKALEEKVKEGKLGRKTGEGFFKY